MRLFALGLLLLCFGCGGSSKASTVGDWKGRLVISGNLSKEDEAMLKLHDLVNLYVSSEKRYYYSLGGVLVEGTLTVDGKKLSFKPEKVGRMPPEVFEKKRGKDRRRVAGDPGVTSQAELSADGETLTMFDADRSTKLVFSRKKSDFKRSGEKTASGSEAGLVGIYAMKVDEAKASPDEIMASRGLFDNSKLKLDQDNTFAMSSSEGVIEGTWKLNDKTLSLVVKRANGSADVPTKAPIVLTLSGSELFPDKSATQSIHFKFVKE
ncbi:MAG: hypothetical protein ABL962_00210 [Fimbriimonadaceae bacterium]